jgi:hypothetical protein
LYKLLLIFHLSRPLHNPLELEDTSFLFVYLKNIGTRDDEIRLLTHPPCRDTGKRVRKYNARSCSRRSFFLPAVYVCITCNSMVFNYQNYKIRFFYPGRVSLGAGLLLTYTS